MALCMVLNDFKSRLANRKTLTWKSQVFEYKLQPSPLTFGKGATCWWHHILSSVKTTWGAMLSLVRTHQHSCPTIFSYSNDIMLLVTTWYWILCNIKWMYDSLQPKLCTYLANIQIVAMFVATVQPRKCFGYYGILSSEETITHLKIPM